MVGAACVLVLLLGLWGLSNSSLFKASTGDLTLDVLISPSFMAEIPVEQLREQLNHELQRLDVPSVWDSRSSLVDEMRLSNSVASTDLVNQWFNVINSEIDVSNLLEMMLSLTLVLSTTDQIAFTTLD